MATADGIAVDHRNDGLGQTTNLHLHVQDTQAGYAFAIDIAATALDVHVATSTECLVTSAGQQHDADV